MSPQDYRIVQETPGDRASIEALHEEAFGPGRFTRSAYRLREQAEDVPGLNFTGWRNGELAGSIRYSKVYLGPEAGLLLGPLVIRPRFKDTGCGLALMRHSLASASEAGHAWVVLVGDEPYYRRTGFRRVAPGAVTMPGPVDPDRLLFLELKPGAFEAASGRLSGMPG